MNERAKALLRSPKSVTPATSLTTVRGINAAIMRNLSSGNYGVYCSALGHGHRVFKARTKKGELQVQISTGEWIKPGRVWSEG